MFERRGAVRPRNGSRSARAPCTRGKNHQRQDANRRPITWGECMTIGANPAREGAPRNLARALPGKQDHHKIERREGGRYNNPMSPCFGFVAAASAAALNLPRCDSRAEPGLGCAARLRARVLRDFRLHGVRDSSNEATHTSAAARASYRLQVRYSVELGRWVISDRSGQRRTMLVTAPFSTVTN